MNLLSIVIDIVLAAYISWEIVAFRPRYRQLKQEIANGDPQARARVYRRGLIFEWVSAALALLALRFDWSKLNPKFLALDGAGLFGALRPSEGFSKGTEPGLLIGVVAGGIGIALVTVIRNRRGHKPPTAKPTWVSRFLPDFTSLIPVAMSDRLLYAALAISAGICEEVVFRGWLMATLHSAIGLSGTALVLGASTIFGLAHAYQKITGMLLTGLAGVLFCLLYVQTGSLLMPILLHVLIDVRFAIMPAPKMAKAETVYA
jgi:uncharacterized protein